MTVNGKEIPLSKSWAGLSSSVLFTGYNPQSEELGVRFNTNKKYIYHKVPFSIWEELLQAESVGKFLNTKVKPIYQCTEQKK